LGVERKHILVVDDDLSTLVYLQKLLLGAHYRVTAVENSNKALKSVREDMPDIVVLDLIMPGMDGYALCTLLRRTEKFKAPILVLSGRATEKDVQAATDAGAAAFLHKPVKSEELLAKVAELLG
jgi:DNA-binding response OmpR family regulator